jgi:regulator of protease activity HflC (stomatin/prohibitin superfamily)
MDFALLSIFAIFALLFFTGVKIIPQQQVWIVERLGKYHGSLSAGLNLIIPFIDRIAYKHTLKERAIDVREQAAITKDNVTLLLDGVIYVRIVDPMDASYGVENPYYAVTQLAQTSMRSAIGKITMDRTFEEREVLNSQIVQTINEAASTWGIQCMRYEIKDIKPPANVLRSMEVQVAAERQKRADILESEGKMQSRINLAEADKQEMILNSEGAKQDQINRAVGEAEALTTMANATAISIEKIANAVKLQGGQEAVALKLAEQYIEAFKQLARTNNTLIIPANTNDVSSVTAQLLAIFKGMDQMNDKACLDVPAKKQEGR